MNIQDLILKLADVARANPNATVYILEPESQFYFDFSGFSVDDNCDVRLDVAGGDKPA